MKLIRNKTSILNLLFGFIVIALVAKYLMITPLNQDDYLYSYKFFSSDSYDWIANGVRLFENDGISFRNPGLPIIIKILYQLDVLYLLPLLNQFVLFLLVVFTYKVSYQIVYSRKLSLLLAIFLFFNFSLQSFANYALADLYAVLFIQISLYQLFRDKFYSSFFLLSVSALFQNFSYLLFPLWIIYYINSTRLFYQGYRKSIENVKLLKEHPIALLIFLTALPTLWHMYKFIKFGDPFYTQIVQFELLRPHVDSIPFYIINSLLVFGVTSLFLLAAIFVRTQKFRDKKIIALIVGTFIGVIFWILLYDWNDKRFLYYLIPFIYPLFAFSFKALFPQMRILVTILILAVTFYPTYFALDDAFTSHKIPLTPFHEVVLGTVVEQNGNREISFSQPIEINRREHLGGITWLLPTKNKYKYYQNGDTGIYFDYKTYAKNYFDSKGRSFECPDKKKFNWYALKSILLIEYNVYISEVDFGENCRFY